MSVEWRNSGRAWRFWYWVLRQAKERCQRHWPFQDRRCPHCGVWQSSVGGYATSDHHGFEDTMRCGQCGKASRWHNQGIVAWTIPARPPKRPTYDAKIRGDWMP